MKRDNFSLALISARTTVTTINAASVATAEFSGYGPTLVAPSRSSYFTHLTHPSLQSLSFPKIIDFLVFILTFHDK